MLVYHQLQLIRKLANRYTAATWTCRQRHDRLRYTCDPSDPECAQIASFA